MERTRVHLFAFLLVLLTRNVLAASAGSALASKVEEYVDRLSSQPTLVSLRNAFPSSRIDLAHYETEVDPYRTEYDRTSCWCAAAVEHLPYQTVRAFLFYVPAANAGAHSPLPAKPNAQLTAQCRAEALWYQTTLNSTASELIQADLIRALTQKWGDPNLVGPRPHIPGNALWTKVVSWRRSDLDVWIAQEGKANLIVFARRNRLPGALNNEFAIGTFLNLAQAARSAADIAALDPQLTAPIVAGANCQPSPSQQLPAGEAGRLFTRWFQTAAGLPPERRAAALFLADLYLGCTQRSPRVDSQYVQQGAKFDGGCTQDGPAYANNFLQEAAKLDPHGPIGELCRLRTLMYPCLLKGRGLWSDLLIEQTEAALREFPHSRWTPYYHYVLARAHAIKLIYSYPIGSEFGASDPVGPPEARMHRDQAIREFRLFLNQAPQALETAFAWQEAWRLLAGLPPTLIQFGCDCE